jgi:hypothetical protein
MKSRIKTCGTHRKSPRRQGHVAQSDDEKCQGPDKRKSRI